MNNNNSNSNHTSPTVVLENGTIIGAVLETVTTTTSTNSLDNLADKQQEIVISQANSEENAHESSALLESQTLPADSNSNDEFEPFLLNRTTSDSNILESSIYSELQFPASFGSGILIDGSGRSTAAPQTATTNTVVDVLNTSTCSRDSRQSKRSRRKYKSKTKCGSTSTTTPHGTPALDGTYPPQYTAIFLDAHAGGGANAMGQIASAAAASPFLNAPLAEATYLHQQYQQYYQQRPLMSNLNAALGHHHHHHRALLDPSISLADGTTTTPTANALTTPVAPLNPPLRISFRKWFSRPSLPFIIGILALGGVACTLGGIVLGSTGLIEHSTQYLSAALLMIGIGVSLLVISGAIWRLSLPDDSDECPCYRHMETCRNCNSPYCNNRLLAGSYLYPEFQHRPPPPSYLTSLNECAAMGLLFHPAAPAQQAAAYNSLRMNTPPPLYRSTNSLSIFVPASNTTNTVATPPPAIMPASNALPALTNQSNSTAGIFSNQNVITMSAVMESLQAAAAAAPLTKEINYFDLD